MACVASMFAALVLSTSACAVVATDLVRIGAERRFSEYATVESKQMRIHWNPAVAHLPQAAVDFLNSHKDGLWDTSLDGVGYRNEQVLAVRFSIDCMSSFDVFLGSNLYLVICSWHRTRSGGQQDSHLS